MVQMSKVIPDEEAIKTFRQEQCNVKELWGTPVPEDQWVGPGATDEFDDGKGDDDDSE